MSRPSLAELSPQERMIAEFQDIALSDEASMTFTTIDPGTGEMHSCTTWYAPLVLPFDDEVRLYSLSAPGPARVHSANIEAWEALGKPAQVSGAVRLDGQKKNDSNCHGVSFHGEARTLRARADIARGLGAFASYNTFDEGNRDKYFNHSTEQIPTHNVVEFLLDGAVVMDGRLGDDNPDRLVRLDWTADQGWAQRS